MYGVASQTIDVSGQAGTDKAYVFEFDPGDLGKKRFASQRFARCDSRHLPDHDLRAIRRSASCTADASATSRQQYRESDCVVSRHADVSRTCAGIQSCDKHQRWP